MNYNTVIKRIQKLIKYEPSQAQLCEITGVKQSTMSQRAKDNSTFKLEDLKKINEYFGINLFTETSEINQSQNTDNIIRINYYPDVYLSAGFGVEVLNENAETIVIDESFLMSERGMQVNPKNCKMVRISGNSMFPEYHHGDRVIIDESDKNLTDGQIYAFRYDGQCYIKEINRAGNKIKCISINREYEPFFIERDVDFTVFGRILPRIRL